MLYVAVNTLGKFIAAFPESRAINYSLHGLQALYEYWESKAEVDDIAVNEELDYPACEYASACKALRDIEYGRYNELVADYENEEELEEAALENLRFYCDHITPLANGGVLVIRH